MTRRATSSRAIATGSSYEYWPGSIMLVTEFIALDLARPEFSLTKMYQTRKWPIVSDYNQLHTGRALDWIVETRCTSTGNAGRLVDR